jgi:hypothetical protein
MEILLIIFGLFIAWRIYVAFLKKRAYVAYDELAQTGSLEEAREQFSRAFEILSDDLHHPGRLPTAEGLLAFDMAVFLQDRIEREEGSWPKTASAETNRRDVGQRLRANLAAEVERRRSQSNTTSTGHTASRRAAVAATTELPIEHAEACVEATSNWFPPVISATHGKTKQLQNYRFQHFRDVVVKGGMTFPLAMIVYENQQMRLVVTSERNSLAPPGSGRSHFLCTWTPSGHDNLGAADKWADADEFSKEAISIAVQSVVLPDQLK